MLPVRVAADTHAAANCTLSAVQTAIDASATGDTVTIPSCSSGEAWTSAATVTGKNIIIQGAGTASTLITATAGSLFNLGTTSSRLTNMALTVSGTATNVVKVYGNGWQVDNILFTNNSPTSTVIFVYAGGAEGIIWPTGVIYQNIIYNGKVLVTDDSSISRPHTRWYTSATLGDENAVYVEDNTFIRTVNLDTNQVDENQGMRYVFRYNTMSAVSARAPSALVHGVQSATNRGGRTWEIYGNLYTNPAGYTKSTSMWARAGTGVMFNNSLVGPWTNTVTVDADRIFDADTTINDKLSGTCDGDNTADGNTLGIGYPCRDQVGMGIDASLFTTSGSPNYTITNAGAQTSTPAYIWGIYDDGAWKNVQAANSSASYIAANRDYYQQVVSFDGTSGTGCGALGARPATCTAGVGYWATAQSCSDLTGMVGATPSTPIAGTLYKCTATDTWTAYYTPYTYPHPLRQAYWGTISTPKGFFISGVNSGEGVTISY